jgi:anti-anti-sigma factor
VDSARSRPAGTRGRQPGPDAARLTVDVTEHGHYAVVAVAGELDIMTSADLRLPLHDLIAQGVLHHVLDLREVTFLDSTGLGILMGERKRLQDRGGSVRAVCGGGLAGRVIRLTAVDKLIDVHDDLRSAVEAITPH